jgi:2,5-dioxopentanoate dehydrogenase
MTTFTAFDPRTGLAGAVQYAEATPEAARAAAQTAERAFASWQSSSPASRAALLRAAADNFEAARQAFVSTADGESGLGAARLNGELDRTTSQLRAFADVLDEGSYVEAIISPADPSAKPVPRPDVRRMLVPFGAVGVFTPSNFPLAFGVAGGDTASALAAGCPVIVKGHPSHPGTSELAVRALVQAAQASGAPDGVIALLQARDLEVARALVTAPAIQAIAFTGSLNAGRAIFDLAASRPQPIPVFAEMGSLNPLFVGPAALRARGKEIADGLASSITVGTGQFCTKPGLIFVAEGAMGQGAEARAFAEMLAGRVAARDPGIMLNAQIDATLSRQISRVRALPGVETLGHLAERQSAGLTRPGVVVTTDLATFRTTPDLHEEHFGPFSVVVRCPSAESLLDVAAGLEGSLTATIHADPEDHAWAGRLADTLRTKAGRIVWNGYPTGVAVTWGMQHGGPYPATTSPGHTSVGATAIRRFLRPVAYQGTPDALLPDALKKDNPLRIQRLVDGLWTRDPA